ncbi:MAG: SgcJ/EcaC family oxidoreductase [Candidatus Competibacter sp.]|nr:SgcJ/EcaC family oxidoreductase [Candidatus Competibacter sp.]
MPITNPEEVLHAFFRAFNQGDIDAVIALYEPRAALVAQPGQVAEGHSALREAFNGFLAMKPTLTPEKHTFVTASDLALSTVKWTLKGTGPDGQPVQMEGTSSDILRKQADGRWLFVIDNPWGAGILS